MRWNVLIEEPANIFNAVPQPWPGVAVDGIWDDGFAADGSDWGDDESNAISAFQQGLQAADEPDHRCFACSWAGL